MCKKDKIENWQVRKIMSTEKVIKLFFAKIITGYETHHSKMEKFIDNKDKTKEK